MSRRITTTLRSAPAHCLFRAGIARANPVHAILASLLVTLLGTLVIAFAADRGVAGGGMVATCDHSLQARIDTTQAGGTVRAEPCIYREQISISKPITLQGQPGSGIRGSDVWTEWTSEGSYWKSAEGLPSFSQTGVRCMPGTSRCRWPEQVFLNGAPLRQVASDPGSGQFAVDAGRYVLLGDDPDGHLVEVSVRDNWVLGTDEADGVTIEGFEMKHAANEGRSGALMNRLNRLATGGSGWTVRDNLLSDAHGAVVSLKGAPGLRILDNEILRGGQMGIHGTGPGEVIRGNEVHHNNTEDFDFRWEAGGIKTAVAEGVTVDSNEIYGNKGNAIWFDINCHNNTISGNRIYDNARRGIHYELSTGARIFDNVLWENGWATPDRGEGSAIGISNSGDVEVHNNTVAWNADGISIVGLDREGVAWDRVYNVHVHDNTILAEDRAGDPRDNLALAWIQGWSDQMFEPYNNNRGENNRYWYPEPEGANARFEWMRIGYPELEGFTATPGDENSRYLTRKEKEAVVQRTDIPVGPQPHVPSPEAENEKSLLRDLLGLWDRISSVWTTE